MPDYGYSKDALRAIIGLSGEFVGTTDTQVVTNKTYNTTDNTLTATSQAAGDILKNNGTSFVRLARGSANQVLKVNSGGTDLDFGTLPVAGGGTGATSLTGVVIGTGTTAMTVKTNPAGAFIGDTDVQNFTGGRKTFYNQTFGLRNPSNTGTLTFTTPEFTGDQEHRLNQPYSYMVWTDGTTVWGMNGATGAIESTATGVGASTTVLQYCLTALATTGGLLHIAAGTYNITAQLTIPQHPGKGITITGEGWRNTTLLWTGAASGSAYVLESYSTTSGGWQILTLKDFQIFGGSSTTNRLVKGLHLGRENSAAVANYDIFNVRVANCISPQVVGNWIQDSFFYRFHCESFGSTPTGIVDFQVEFSSHLNLYGCYVGAVTVQDSTFNCYGGTLEYLEIKSTSDYGNIISGTFFDPVPVGFTHQIQVGTTGMVAGVTFDRVGFSGNMNNDTTDRYFYINQCRNFSILNPKFKTSSTVATFIETTASAVGGVIRYPTEEALSKIINASTTTTIYSPNVNNTININNPSGTSGAQVVDSHTSNRIELANSALHLVNSIKSSSGSARWKVNTRNAANNADVTRIQIPNLQNVGVAPILSFENMTFSGGTTIVPFIKAGTISDSDFLTPTSGMLAFDTTNNMPYWRSGTTWKTGLLADNTVAVTNKTFDSTNTISSATSLPIVTVAKGGTGQATATLGFDALSPMTVAGDLIYGGASGTRTKLGIGTAGQVLQTNAGATAPEWATRKSVGVWYLAALAHANQTVIYVTPVPVLSNVTETIVDLIFDYTFTVKRFRLSVQANTKNANTVFSFRDDAADVTGATITVAAGVTGEHDSGALSVDVVAGSKINWKVDATASASGSITFFGFVEYEIALQ